MYHMLKSTGTHRSDGTLGMLPSTAPETPIEYARSSGAPAEPLGRASAAGYCGSMSTLKLTPACLRVPAVSRTASPIA